MAVFTVNQSLPQAAKVISSVESLRTTINFIRDISLVLDEMDDAQVLALTGFSGTAAQLRATLASARTTLTSDTAITNMITLLAW